MCICISIAQAAEEPPSIMPAESHEEAMSQVAVTVRQEKAQKRNAKRCQRRAEEKQSEDPQARGNSCDARCPRIWIAHAGTKRVSRPWGATFSP